MCRSLAVRLLVVSLAAASSGCIKLVVVGGDGGTAPTTVAYSMGRLDGALAAGPESVVEAAKGALEEMKIPIESAAATSVDGKIAASTATGTKIGITVKKDAENISKVSIRVGQGGEKLGVEIYEKILARLKR
jgi:hypothetical protein